MTEKEKLERFYNAAISALAHIDCDVEGIYPKDCSCDTRKKYAESVELLTDVKNELINAK